MKEKTFNTHGYKLKSGSPLSCPITVSIPKLKHCPHLPVFPGKDYFLGIFKHVYELLKQVGYHIMASK